MIRLYERICSFQFSKVTRFKTISTQLFEKMFLQNFVQEVCDPLVPKESSLQQIKLRCSYYSKK